MEKIWKSLINLYFLMEGMKLQIYIIQSYFAFNSSILTNMLDDLQWDYKQIGGIPFIWLILFPLVKSYLW